VLKVAQVKWTREHFLIALNLYRKLLFGQLHKGNRLIIEVAEKMGRTPSSLAMKLCNFASLDPVQQARGIRGLSGATKQDREMWRDFEGNINELGPQSEQLLHDLFTTDDACEVDFLRRDKVRLERPKFVLPTRPTEKEQTVRVRRGQQFFRQSVLNAYGARCAITGINVPRLLVASHIKPWSQFPGERLNPRNGLCLSSIHDAAFDGGLISFDEKTRLVMSRELRGYLPSPALEENFSRFEGKPLRLPEKVAEPSQDFLSYHRSEIFLGI